MNSLEIEFHKAMINIYERAKNEANYLATYFLRMVSENGGVKTAKILINSNKPSDGYTALYMKSRLDLTVESLVQDSKWAPLFDVAEIKKAKVRLHKYGYEIL